jgi:hypothetical protein
MPFALSKLKRPRPPRALLESFEGETFLPAPEVRDWFTWAFLSEGAPLHNPDHDDLLMADIGVVWTDVKCVRQMIQVVGMMELARPSPMDNQWKKARYNHQLKSWFGNVPDFLMTLYAPHLSEVDNATFCAIVEHELYHARLRFITRQGKPVWAIYGHDVEEHVGIVARYGAGAAAGKTVELVAAAKKKPLVAPAQVSMACGTCLRLAA